MPEPRKGERQNAFISRYVKSKKSKKHFPDVKQRLAVAYSTYRQNALRR